MEKRCQHPRLFEGRLPGTPMTTDFEYGLICMLRCVMNYCWWEWCAFEITMDPFSYLTLVGVPSSGRVPVQMVNFSNSASILPQGHRSVYLNVLMVLLIHHLLWVVQCWRKYSVCGLSPSSTNVEEMMERMEIDKEIKTSPEQLEAYQQ